MPDLAERTEPLPFSSYWYDGLELYDSFQSLIEEGTLPFDAAFRFAAIGDNQRDPENPRRRLSWNLLQDMVAHAGVPDTMRPETQILLYGERPKLIVDDNISGNRPAYRLLDPMYYHLGNLGHVIREDRADRGKTITEVPRHWTDTPQEHEWNACVGLARPIWRVLISRTRPDIITHPKEFVRPTITMDQVYYASERSARRRAIGQAVISDSVVLKIYQEAVTTGVKGIGPAGRRHLRTLLSDEHPELI
jgi:hypothetical protein